MLDKSVSEELITAAGWIAASRNLVVSTGAGVSRESGIPTFREAGLGFWEKYDPQQLATVQGFLEDPKLVWDWYAYRRKTVAQSSPNPGHYALAELEKLLPGMVLITQNIDSLHVRAGSCNVVELHGNISRVRCFNGCLTFENWKDEDSAGETPPRCSKCGSYLRPDVVWFGEALPDEGIHRAFRAAESCDLMLVVGTSGVVQPAASLPSTARYRGARIVEVNPEESEITSLADIVLRGKSGDILPLLLPLVRESLAGVRVT
jgi:NAD-dependent deacetylase